MITNLYKVDSFKIIFDKDIFKGLYIPEKYFLIDENGDILQELKKKGYEVPFNEFTSIFIANYTKQLRGITYNKVVILFSSKVCRNYFDGIKITDIENILIFLKNKKILDFDNTEDLLKNGHFNDLDICKDIVFSNDDKHKLISNFKEQVKQYKGDKKIGSGIKFYNNFKNFGLEVNHRSASSLAKPFFKIYDKNLELRKKHINFFYSLPENLRWFIETNLIIRFEFTLKNKNYFDKFNISNNIIKFYDIINYDQEKLKEIQQYFINANFIKKIIVKNRNNLTPLQQVIANLLLLNMDENKNKHDLMFYENLFVSDLKGTQATRMRKLFEFIYSNVTNFAYKEIKENINFAKKYEELFF